DIDQRLVDVAAGCIDLWTVAGGAVLADVVADPPPQAADVALLLKSVPCLEQQEKGSGIRLVDAARAPYVVVSFPTHSLGGASKGMISHYQRVMAQMTAERPWRLTELTFPSELVYIVQKTVDQ
ncbi:MAG TPA: 16S rRNA methyltransferase, partial [Chloroflexota bacterium]|nr:16S rRNA methyltransferase [Chloroflexota bacterium]